MAAMYRSSNYSSSSHFREKMSEILDRMYPNTVPASRRKDKDRSKTLAVQKHIEEEQQKRREALLESRTRKTLQEMAALKQNKKWLDSAYTFEAKA